MSRCRLTIADPIVYFERPAPLRELIALLTPLTGEASPGTGKLDPAAEQLLTPHFPPGSADAQAPFHRIAETDCLGACTYRRTGGAPSSASAEHFVGCVDFYVAGADDAALGDLILTIATEFSGEIALGAAFERLRPEEHSALPGRVRRTESGEERCNPAFFSALRKRPSFRLST